MATDAFASIGWLHLAGYAFSLLVGHVAVRWLLDAALRLPWHRSTALLGFVERFLYTTAVIVGAWAFFPIWLGMKVAREAVARWGSGEGGIQLQRLFFNRWLAGVGLSLIYGVAGGQIARVNIYGAVGWQAWEPRAIIAFGLFGASLLAWVWLRTARRD